MADKFITINKQRIRKDTIRRYEPRLANDDRCKVVGVTVFLDDGTAIVDWDQTAEDIDGQMQ